MSQQPPRVFRMAINRDRNIRFHLLRAAKEMQGKKILGKKIAIVLSYVFARDLFAFGVFLARQPGDARRRGCMDQPEFAKLPPKKAPRPYTKLCKLAGRRTHVPSNATFTATGEFANHLRVLQTRCAKRSLEKEDSR